MRAVELAGLLFERRADLLIGADVFARRRGDLDEQQLVDHVVVAGEQPFERVDPFGKPLAVIEPVDADRDRSLARAAAEPLLRSPRSEEHTSELQTLMRSSYAVFCLK